MNYKSWRICLQDVNVNVAKPLWTGQGRDWQQSGRLRKHLGGCHFFQMQSCWKGLAEVLVSTSLAATDRQLHIVLLLHLLNHPKPFPV